MLLLATAFPVSAVQTERDDLIRVSLKRHLNSMFVLYSFSENVCGLSSIMVSVHFVATDIYCKALSTLGCVFLFMVIVYVTLPPLCWHVAWQVALTCTVDVIDLLGIYVCLTKFSARYENSAVKTKVLSTVVGEEEMGQVLLGSKYF